MNPRRMRLVLSNGWGDEVESPSVDQMRAFLDDADPAHSEHGDVSLEWTDRSPRSLLNALMLKRSKRTCLTWTEGRLVMTVDSKYVRHLPDVARDDVLRLWRTLSDGDLDDLEREPWLDGDGDLDPEEKRAMINQAVSKLDREFYDSLGDERPEEPCRRAGCTRGAVTHSVLCRAHHFESIKGRPCPFPA